MRLRSRKDGEMGKYLDQAGLEYVWDKAKSTFVIAEEGKGLSSNDFTDEWKQKVEDLEETAGNPEVITSEEIDNILSQ